MAAAGAPIVPSGPQSGEAGVKAHIMQVVKRIKAVLRQDAPTTELLISQANVNPDERGWLFAVKTLRKDWPQQTESYIKLGQQRHCCQCRRGQEHDIDHVCA